MARIVLNFCKISRKHHNAEKLAPLVREIGWAHNLLILERCKDQLKREFYLRVTRKFGWSKNVLAHQINKQSYEKSLFIEGYIVSYMKYKLL